MPPADGLQGDERRSLAAMLHSARFAELEAEARQLLMRHPRSALLWQLLAVARAGLGKDALQALAMAVDCAPEDAAARLNLGNALGRLGRLDAAAECYRRAIAIDPRLAEAHSNLGDVQLELGLLDESMASCRRALEIKPEFAAAHQHLAKALWRSGSLEEALAHARRALDIDADFAEAHNTLGTVLLKLARRDQAEASFRRALELVPEFAEARVNLANARRSVGQLDEAVAGYRRALETSPDFAAAYVELATALRLQRRGAECESACRRALDKDPDSTAALTVLAELRADGGRFADAEELFRRAAQIDPRSPEAWAGIARSRRMTSADGAWLAAAQGLADRGMPASGEMRLRYALGKYFDDLGAYEPAFANYRRANELAKLCGPRHDRAALTRMVDLIIRSYDRDWIGRVRSGAGGSPLPVLVVGMLRSGTTLAEQILASHPSVFGAGELTHWGSVLEAACGTAADAVDAMRLSDAALAASSRRYRELLEDLSPGALRVVDKMPTNFFALALICAALPRVRIIHMRRNPADTCLSIYFQHFEAANTYANDLDDLAHYALEYRRLMRHWQSTLPADALLDVPYEGLVADPEGWSRRMTAFIGLPWDARCLEFHRSARTVVTASKWQVRQRINTASVGRWRRYEKFIGPLLEAGLSVNGKQ